MWHFASFPLQSLRQLQRTSSSAHILLPPLTAAGVLRLAAQRLSLDLVEPMAAPAIAATISSCFRHPTGAAELAGEGVEGLLRLQVQEDGGGLGAGVLLEQPLVHRSETQHLTPHGAAKMTGALQFKLLRSGP